MKFRDPDLPLAERVDDLIGRLSIKEKASQLVMKNAAIERLGIRGFYHWWNEALHGYARAGVATVFPQAIGLAATWSPEMLRKVGDVASTEGRAKYNEELASNDGNSRSCRGITIWSPNINIFRDPRWGRGQETYGEDPFLTASLADGFVRGLQGDHPRYLKTVATLKHFAVHSGPEPLRHEFDAKVSDKDLRDTYLPAFEEGIRYSGAKSVMSAYNGFNGTPCVSSRSLLTEILRDEWGFDGAVVGDVDNVVDLYSDTGHRTARDGAEAVALALRAGNDLRSAWDVEQAQHALDALERGLITEEDIDLALTRLMTLRFRLGQFDPPENVPWSSLTTKVVESDEHVRLAYEASRQSLVLLKNDGALPLKTDGLRKVALIGPAGDDMDVLIGNYAGDPFEPVTILRGLKDKLEPLGVEILHEPDIPFAAGYSTKGVPVPGSVFFTDAEATQRGLTCGLFNNGKPEGEPVIERVDSEPSIEWTPAQPAPGEVTAERASAVYSGFLKPPASGEYTFHARMQGVVILEIDGKEVLRGRSGGDVGHASGRIELEADRVVPVRITWRQLKETAFLRFEWNPADGGRAIEQAYERAGAAARGADVVILTLGLSHKLEGEEMKLDAEGFSRGDRTSIALPAPQQELIDRVAGLGKKTILLLSTGSAVAFDPEQVNAALQTWYYGAQGGRAVADALFGEFSPAGRLPVTFYKSDSDLPDFEDYSMKGRTYRYFDGKPLFAFGHGLTYTEFGYTSLEVSKSTVEGESKAGLVASVEIENSRERASDEVVQIYAAREDRREGDPIRWLVGYKRVPDMKPGEKRTVSIDIPLRRLALWDDDQEKRVVDPGEIIFSAGPSSDDLRLHRPVVVPLV